MARSEQCQQLLFDKAFTGIHVTQIDFSYVSFLQLGSHIDILVIYYMK